MIKKSSLSFLELLLVFIAFIVYECSWMFAGIDDLSGTISLFGTTSSLPVLLLIISLLYLRQNKTKIKDNIYQCFLLYFLLSYLVTVIGSLFKNLDSNIVLISSFLPIVFWQLGSNLSFYRKQLTIQYLIPMTFIFLSIFFFLRYDKEVFLNKDLAAINSSYIIIYLLPFLLLSEKKWFRVGAIILTAIITMSSLKRGGMISLSVGVLSYLLIYDKVKFGRLISFKGVLIIGLMLCALYYLVVYLNNSMDDLVFNRFSSMKDDGGSGRSDIYKNVIELISTSSIGGLFVGHGWGGVAQDSLDGLTAHNDFLEIIYDFGVITFIIYIIFVIKLLRQLVKMIKLNHNYAPAFAASLAIFLTNSLVSHICIYPWYFIAFTLFWGFVTNNTKYQGEH